jgi:hypothetical protein
MLAWSMEHGAWSMENELALWPMEPLERNMRSRKIPYKIKDFYLLIPGYAIRPGSSRAVYHRSGVDRICHLVDKMVAAGPPGTKVVLYFDTLDARARDILRTSLDNDDIILCDDYSQIVPEPYIYLVDSCGH